MLNPKKSLKLAGALAIALGAAVPMMTSAASAAPIAHSQMQRVAQNERVDGHRDFRDGEHRGFEHRDFREHGGRHCHHGFLHEWRGRHER